MDYSLFFVDDTPPVLDCQGNLTVKTDSGVSFATVTYFPNVTTITDNSNELLSAVETPPPESDIINRHHSSNMSYQGQAKIPLCDSTYSTTHLSNLMREFRQA